MTQIEPKRSSSSNRKAIFYLILLAIQFGIQPILTRRYTPTTIINSTVILVQELVKFTMAWMMLSLSGATAVATKGTSFKSKS